VNIDRATSEFCDWEGVRRLIQDAFAYMDGRIDPPSSALTLTQEAMTADASKGAMCRARTASPLATILCCLRIPTLRDQRSPAIRPSEPIGYSSLDDCSTI